MWPNYAGESKQVCFVVKTIDGFESSPFPLENPGRFVLILKPAKTTTNQKSSSNISNINEITTLEQSNRILTILISGGSQNPVTIIIRKYQYGDSVAKFVNLCDGMNIQLKQKNMDSSWKLEPMKSMFFTWPELVRSTRELTWTVNSSNNYLPLKLTSSGKDDYTISIVNDTSMRSNSENDTHDGKVLHNLYETINIESI